MLRPKTRRTRNHPTVFQASNTNAAEMEPIKHGRVPQIDSQYTPHAAKPSPPVHGCNLCTAMLPWRPASIRMARVSQPSKSFKQIWTPAQNATGAFGVTERLCRWCLLKCSTGTTGTKTPRAKPSSQPRLVPVLLSTWLVKEVVAAIHYRHRPRPESFEVTKTLTPNKTEDLKRDLKGGPKLINNISQHDNANDYRVVAAAAVPKTNM